MLCVFLTICFFRYQLVSNVINISLRVHLVATISRLFFGYLPCSGIELDNVVKNGQKEAVALVRRQAHPCKLA
jgi:hypothetical protein